MKRIFIFILLILAITGCTAIEEFNKKLENINKSLPTSSSSGTEVIELVANTGGKGKFENAKVTIKPRELNSNSREVNLSGYYTNTTKSYQKMVKIEVDIKDKDGDTIKRGYFYIEDINAGERKNISKIKQATIGGNGIITFYLEKDEYIDRKSWKVSIF